MINRSPAYENVRLGRAKVAEAMDVAAIQSVVVIGKVLLDTALLDERGHEHDEFRTRVLSEFDEIPRYLSEGFLAEAAA